MSNPLKTFEKAILSGRGCFCTAGFCKWTVIFKLKICDLQMLTDKLWDLITQCGAISKLINDTVSKQQLMSSSSDKQIYPNNKLWIQVKPTKFHKTKKLQSKRKAASFSTFEEKEAFIKNYIKCKSLSCKDRQWKSKSFLKMIPL